MLNVALVAILAALQPSAAAQSPTAAQPDVKGQPCTAQELIGTWQSTSKPSTADATTALKHVTPTHFFVVHLSAKNVVRLGHGGRYTLANGTYTETLEHGFGEAFEKYPGASVSFRCGISGDMLHIVGEYQGHKLNEQWRRAAGNASKP